MKSIGTLDYYIVDSYLLLNESQNSDKVDFRSLKELPVST